jgi:hypothetical protein
MEICTEPYSDNRYQVAGLAFEDLPGVREGMLNGGDPGQETLNSIS